MMLHNVVGVVVVVYDMIDNVVVIVILQTFVVMLNSIYNNYKWLSKTGKK